jgi:hypothetical protein
MKLLITISFLTLATLTLSASIPQDTLVKTAFISSDQALADRRGIAFNENKFSHLFMGANNKIDWMYKWASDLCGRAHDATKMWMDFCLCCVWIGLVILALGT